MPEDINSSIRLIIGTIPIPVPIRVMGLSELKFGLKLPKLTFNHIVSPCFMFDKDSVKSPSILIPNLIDLSPPLDRYENGCSSIYPLLSL